MGELIDHGDGNFIIPTSDSFAIHEALHVTSLFSKWVEQDLLEHTAIQANPEWKSYVDTVVTALNELYQEIGKAHIR